MIAAAFRRSASFLLGALVLTACGGGDGDPTQPTRTPATVAASVTPPSTAAAGSALTTLPAVIVRDNLGDPLANVPVTFVVTAGGGQISGATTTTNASGIATLGGWTLGPNAGVNTLLASVTGLTPVTFSVTGTVAANACDTRPALAVGDTVRGVLADADCRLSDGTPADLYTVTVGNEGAVRLELASDAFDAYVYALRPGSTGDYLGVADNLQSDRAEERLKLISGPRTVLFVATAYENVERGAYTARVRAASTSLDGCEVAFAVAPVTVAQTLASSDCTTGLRTAGRPEDEVGVYLANGQTLTVRASSTAIDPVLSLYGFDATGNTRLVAENDNGGGGTTALLTYRATASDFFVVRIGTTAGVATGSYSLSVEGPVAASASAAARLAREATALPRPHRVEKGAARR